MSGEEFLLFFFLFIFNYLVNSALREEAFQDDIDVDDDCHDHGDDQDHDDDRQQCLGETAFRMMMMSMLMVLIMIMMVKMTTMMCEAPEPKPLLPVADGPEVEHVGALGLHLVHLLSNVGGEKTLKMGGLKLHLFRTGTGYKGFTSGSSWGSCLLIGQHKTLSVHACQPHSTDVTYRVEMSPDEMSPDDR